ncbi:MAG: N-acetylmuramoyl-L-alanine amidase [Clostridia bacterium]|nr:N-acetylmuramoyl-L-alanine amidase [Clostridia bacterium]
MKYILIFFTVFSLFLAGCVKNDIPEDGLQIEESETTEQNQMPSTSPVAPPDISDVPVMPEDNEEAPEIPEHVEIFEAEIEKNDEIHQTAPDIPLPEIPVQSEPTESTKPTENSVTVSHLAKEDFLTPFDNYSWEREYAPEYVVLHFTSAVMVLRDDPYNMDAMRKIFADGGVSPHYIVDRDGSILCFIPEDRAAWHAGKGSYGGDERLTDSMNKYSIGIEIAAMGSYNDMSIYMSEEEYNKIPAELIGFTDSQYEALKSLVGDICERYSIPFDNTHVIGHDMYSDRKTDPGELFDWDRLFS